MLHEDKAETGIYGQMVEQFGKGFQSSGGGADADNGERLVRIRASDGYPGGGFARN